MLKEGGGDTIECQDDGLPAGARRVYGSRPLWVASLYPPRKYINILVENLYYAIGIFYIE